jgi:type III restriction enzyme
MFILKPFQEKAVDNLLELTFDALQETSLQTKILLEAPTGSGKTVMMASLIERIVEELPMQPRTNGSVAFIWFAPNTLHIQSFKALQKMYADANKLHCIDLSSLSGNPILNHKDLLFINWSSVDKVKGLWRRENETNTNLETLIENTKAEDTKIILVIDEAHLSAFSGPQAIAVRKLIGANAEIMVTATPTFQRPQRTVSISRKKVIEEQMIKKGVRINIGLDPKKQQSGENLNIHLLRTAFAKKQELATMFDAELGKNVINPLILIQLPSDSPAMDEEDKSLRLELEGLLNTEYNISTNNGRLAIWLSGERNKDGLEDMNGFQDVLIFKQAIAQGWDCPRATILISYRKVNSTEFGIQTVGRILRMPHQRHYKTDALNYGYVFSDIETNKIIFVPTDNDYFDKQFAERQNNKGWHFDLIPTATIVNDRVSPGVLNSKFYDIFNTIVEERYGITQLPHVDLFKQENLDLLKDQIDFNKNCLIQNGWEFEIDINQIHVPVDIEVDPYEVNSIMLNHKNIAHFALTIAEFGEMFNAFCLKNITVLNKSKSWKVLKRTLIEFAEIYFGINEFDARKLFLFPQNKALLVQHIAVALEQFVVYEKARGNNLKRVEMGSWEVPLVRFYSEHFEQQNIDNHALKPFFEQKTASTAEKAFAAFLKENQNHLEWWYKNGDSGQEHFAVNYKNAENENRLFYVDFVIKFKSNKIGLFDTKTKRSDIDAPRKHNALLDFMDKENILNPNRELIGGVLIPDDNGGVSGFRYPLFRINDTNDLTGWSFFNPAEINN